MAQKKPKWTAASVQATAQDLATQIKKEFKIDVDGPFDMGIDSIAFHPNSQVREAGGVKLDKALVGQYANHIKADVALPPIIVNDNHELADGNTRKQAAVECGQDIAPVVVVHTKGNHLLDRMIAGWANQRGGKRLTDRESARLARELAGDGMKADLIARRLGYSPNKVNQIVKAVETEQRAEALGIELDGMAEGVKVKLHASKLPLDVAFVEAVKLAQDANLKPTHVTTLVRSLEDVGTEEGARSVVATARGEHQERIEQVKAGLLDPKPSPWQTIKMHIGALAKVDLAKLEMVPVGDPEATVSRINEAIDVLAAARTIVERQQ